MFRFFKGKQGSRATPNNLAEGSKTPRERAGLFSFPIDPNRTELLITSAEVRNLDVIAVHGLGGDWLKTWRAGEKDDSPIWLRDRVPYILAEKNVQARILSFGYDANFVFTNSVADLDVIAKNLLDFLLASRTTEEQKKAPIVFVAHSLGGLVVKQALNLAWDEHLYYQDILNKVGGCLFLGVPHHGASLASWATHSAQILKVISFNLAGNERIVQSLKKQFPDWLKISKRFVQRGKSLAFRSFYETETTGSFLVVDEQSAIMQLPNERYFALSGSNHQNICKFRDDENQRFLLVGAALAELVQFALDKS